jgi:DsbC/DsbD-like thiol-disulfide interchange protein/cytochrome c biogenesis protein CcdA
MARFFLFLTLLLFAPAFADAQRDNAIRPELVAQSHAVPGSGTEIAILMHTRPGWHGYWLNPGDAGLPMTVDWQLPDGWRVTELRYPVPTKLLVAGIVNYVYEKDYAVLARLVPPKGVTGSWPVSAKMRWLACTDKVCVPEKGEIRLDVPTSGLAVPDSRFNDWLRALPRPLAAPAHFALDAKTVRVAIPLPASVTLPDPMFFPAADGPIDYAAEQVFIRQGDTLIVELARRRGEPKSLAGVLAFGDGRGLEIEAVPGAVATPRGEAISLGLVGAIFGAILGGLILNLMPCVFPILGLKAMHLAKAGGDERHARRDALGYTLGAIVGTGLLGIALLALRASGEAAGWAFQLQDPRSILLLLLIAVAITLNLLRVYALPTIGGEANPTSSVGTGALAAFVATPCAGPFLGTALGAALLLPVWGAVLVFAALGLGLALPFLAIAFIPALRRRLPKPGPWMTRLQRILAIPMALSAAACLWLLWRQGGQPALLVGIAALVAVGLLLVAYGVAQRKGRAVGIAVVAAIALVGIGFAQSLPTATVGRSSATVGKPWSHDAIRAALATGKPVFVNFTADWCLTCKANEATAIDRDSVRDAFKKAGVVELTGDWTDGDPAITRFLESRGRAGVPLYLWYEPGQAQPEELPQLLSPSMLSSRAARPR